MSNRRSKGATIGLVASIVLVIIVVGTGLYFLAKIIGGGREMNNATDSGTLNVAKQAVRDPGKPLAGFSKVVQDNFAGLVDPKNNNLDLLVYNRMVAQALIVSLNAKDENKATASANAKKVYDALNEVGTYLYNNLNKPGGQLKARGYFEGLANNNNLRMIGNNGVVMTSYDCAYMKATESTNVAWNPALLANIPNSGVIKLSTGQASTTPGQTGFKFMQGYAPISISMLGGQTLVFSGVPLSPKDSAHLVSLGDFSNPTKSKPNETFLGVLAGSVPANTYRCTGQTIEAKSNGFLSSVACAIAAAGVEPPTGQGLAFQAAFPNGYLTLVNGPSAGGVPAFAGGDPTGNYDIFMNELGVTDGIAVTGSGNQNGACFVLTNEGLFTAWANHNKNNPGGAVPDSYVSAAQLNESINGTAGGGKFAMPWRDRIFPSTNPDRKITLAELQSPLGPRFTSGGVNWTDCNWPAYDNPAPPGKMPCLLGLSDFKTGYNRDIGWKDPIPGPNTNGSGWTILEVTKTRMLENRYDLPTGPTVNQGWTNLVVPNGNSGVKWFDHTFAGAMDAPGSVNYNFGQVKSPYDYIAMIDDVAAAVGVEIGSSGFQTIPSNCGKNQTIDTLLQRCKEIVPAATKADLIAALKMNPLPLGGTLYLYSPNGTTLATSATPPRGFVSALDTPDGSKSKQFCEGKYTASRNVIDTGGDGGWADPYHECSKIKCNDWVDWTPSTGYNNLLGSLEFSNGCYVVPGLVSSNDAGSVPASNPGEIGRPPPSGGGTAHFGRAN